MIFISSPTPVEQPVLDYDRLPEDVQGACNLDQVAMMLRITDVADLIGRSVDVLTLKAEDESSRRHSVLLYQHSRYKVVAVEHDDLTISIMVLNPKYRYTLWMSGDRTDRVDFVRALGPAVAKAARSWERARVVPERAEELQVRLLRQAAA